MNRLRSCLKMVAATKLKIPCSPAPEEAEAYRHLCLDLSFSCGADAPRFRVLLRPPVVHWWLARPVASSTSPCTSMAGTLPERSITENM